MTSVPEQVGVASQTAQQPPAAQSVGFPLPPGVPSGVPPGVPPGVAFASQVNVASLYVGELKSEVSEQLLWTVFSPYGQVVSVKVCRDSQTQMSLGYAYVNFRTTQEAEKAMEQVNFTPIDGKPCRVMWSMRDASRRKFGVGNLFIKNIDPNLDAKSLYQAFSSFGPVLSCKIALDEYGLSKGYGFIQFYNEVDATKARERSNGVRFSKKKLVVTKFIPKNERKDAKPFNPDEYTNIFVKNFTKEWTDSVLRKQFEKFGEITSCVVQKNEKGESLCYGFVNFVKHENAAEAVKEMNESLIEGGNKITVCRAMKKLERQAYLKRQYEERKREIFKKFQNMNLYVKNFDESITDEKLKALFAEFGDVKSAHVMKDENNRSRCFGFVCFSKPEEAERALNQMNSKVIDGRPLYVSHAQSKEERRKIIEQQTYNTSFRGPLMPPQAMPFMYPPPGTFSYGAQGQFTRYQQSGPRMQNRSMPQGSMQSNPNFIPGNRPPYFNQNGGNFQQNSYRHRNNQMGQRSQPGGGYSGRPNQGNQQQQVAVNSVATNSVQQNQENQQKNKDQRNAPKSQNDPRAEFKNQIFKVCQSVFTSNNFDLQLLSRVAGLVIDYFDTDSTAHSHTQEKDIRDAVVSAYGSALADKSGSNQ